MGGAYTAPLEAIARILEEVPCFNVATTVVAADVLPYLHAVDRFFADVSV
jgi:predicted TPR repeat methyltransferase